MRTGIEMSKVDCLPAVHTSAQAWPPRATQLTGRYHLVAQPVDITT